MQNISENQTEQSLNSMANTKVYEYHNCFYIVDKVIDRGYYLSIDAYNITAKRNAFIITTKEEWNKGQEMEYTDAVAKLI